MGDVCGAAAAETLGGGGGAAQWWVRTTQESPYRFTAHGLLHWNWGPSFHLQLITRAGRIHGDGGGDEWRISQMLRPAGRHATPDNQTVGVEG